MIAHSHVTLSHKRYSYMIQDMVEAMQDHPGYWNDFVSAHKACGLHIISCHDSSCVAMASLTPRKEKEITIVSCMTEAEMKAYDKIMSYDMIDADMIKRECPAISDMAEMYARIMKEMVESRTSIISYHVT